MPGAYGHGASALAMPNERWQEVVSDLIGKAEMIVAEVPVLTAARCAVRARDLCREGENRANRCDYSGARRPFSFVGRRGNGPSNSLECCGTTNCRPWEPKTTSCFAT